MSFETMQIDANTATESRFAFLNILLENKFRTKVIPQADRINDLAEIIREVVPDADLFGACEVEGENGYNLAKRSGFTTSRWESNDRTGEHIGFMLTQPAPVEFLPLDNTFTAALTFYKGIAVVMLHLKYDPFSSRQRIIQIQAVLDSVRDCEQAIVMGDFNATSWQRPRRLLVEAGFSSAFGQPGRPRIPHVPVREHLPYATIIERIGRVGRFAVDDIYVKGLDVLQANATTTKKSDHPLLDVLVRSTR